MNKILDKPFTLRQFFRLGPWVIGAAAPLYLVAVFLNAWDLKTGGVSLNNSPFKDQIPERCLTYAQRSFGTPGGRTALDNFLLQRRLTRQPIEGLTSGQNLARDCLGYAVLSGLHGVPWVSDFTEQWVDKSGDPIVTVRVEFDKTYVDDKK
jgi:hypothetical protein